MTKVLYIEDNPYSARLMELSFKRYSDFNLKIAQDAQSGIDEALIFEPDAILVDINLPDMDGWELTRKLREHPLMSGTPIIAVTSLNAEEHHRKSYEAGCNLHLGKPVRYQALISQIQDLINPTSPM